MNWLEIPKVLSLFYQSIVSGTNPPLPWFLLFIFLYFVFRPGDLVGDRKGGLFYRDLIVIVEPSKKPNILILYGISYWAIQLFVLLGFCISFSPWHQAMPAIGGVIALFSILATLSNLYKGGLRSFLFKAISALRSWPWISRRSSIKWLLFFLASLMTLAIYKIIEPRQLISGRNKVSTGDVILIDNYQDKRDRNDEWLKENDAPWKATCREAWRLKADKRYEDFLEICPNDSEAQIYSNNLQASKAASKDSKIIFNVVASVPISRDSGQGVFQSMEVLRGISLGQQDINNYGKIKFGTKAGLLKIYIIDDGDYRDIPRGETSEARQVAQDISRISTEEKLVAVIGPVTSDSTEAASKIYKNSGLVLISPASTAVRSSGFLRMLNALPFSASSPLWHELNLGLNVFRVAPNDQQATAEISDYIDIYNRRIAQGKIRKIVLVYQQNNRYGELYKKTLRQALDKYGLTLVNNEGSATDSCAIQLNDISSRLQCKEFIAREADAVFFVPSSKSAPDMLRFVQEQLNERKKNLKLFGADSMYNSSWLKQPFAGMVVVAPNRRIRDKNESWRTAMGYDAIQAIARGITNISNSGQCNSYPTNSMEFSKCIRINLPKALMHDDFIADGALGPSTVQFDDNGDRVADINKKKQKVDYGDKLEVLYCIRPKGEKLVFDELGGSEIC